MLKFCLPLASLFLMASLTATSCGSHPDESGTETVEAAEGVQQLGVAPDFALKDADGREIKLSDFKGKVVLLNFWATWCGPCKIEMPWFVDFQRKYKDRGFSVVAVSLDEEGWEVVKPFVEQFKLNFPIVVGNDEVADRFGGVAALPTTLIIDKQGKIASRHTGLVSMSDYEDQILELL